MATTPEEADLRSLHRLGPGSPAARVWLHERFPSGVPFAWWRMMVDFAESEMISLTSVSVERRRERLSFAADLVEWAVEEGWPSDAAVLWLWRFASPVRGMEELAGDLPEALTPDGIARRALASFRLSRDRAAEISVKLRETSVERLIFGGDVTDDEFRAFKELGGLFSCLRATADDVEDESLAAELRRWLVLDLDWWVGARRPGSS